MNATRERRTVVVGVDGSEQSRLALQWAMREARMRQARLDIVHAWLWPLYHVPLGPPPGGPGDSGLQAEAKKMLAEARREVAQSAPDVPVETHLVTGAAGAVLTRFAVDAELVVVGNRGLGGFSELLIGSTGVHVSIHSSCPVAVVRGDDRTEGPVVVGIDGSEPSEDALTLAFEEAEMRRAPLVALHAWEYPASLGVDIMDWGFDTEQQERHAYDLVDATVNRWAWKFPGVRIERRVVRTSPARALVQASADAQLVVVGSRGHGAVRRSVVGSTSHALLLHSQSPVLLVRHRHEHADEDL
ncbi:MAG: universal stress protein [Actinomycetes bacterium]